ncbi:glycosyltransferase [Desulfopila inferna]|uniref:glycosyltransferase n=1 Tax=Desulfopila inferna TaxID=468528 RepID=UPI00196681D8|nr:glycosyltransferase [Desulfopila inferna]MBM9602696.1 glycosyltransferase [Desulfopila inferna]
MLNRVNDRSSLSIDLEKASCDWISEYHLSSERPNIYRFLDLSKIKTGLELGSGCGAITRYLGETGMQLDAVEGSRKRAEICRLRCDDLDNVHVVHSNFNELDLPEQNYDAVFLNGVLEYAGRFLETNDDDLQALKNVLHKSLQTLTPQGVACIAIENRMGLKYWLGAREDHFGLPYVGLYGYPQDEGIRTYDRNEWQTILAGLDPSYQYRFVYPFPDYKMARTILSEKFIRETPHAANHLFRMASTDNGKPVNGAMNEFLLWESLQAQNLFEQYANSFFILISRSNETLSDICPYDFMHFSGKGRRTRYRTVTSKMSGTKIVEKKLLYSSLPQKDPSVDHDLSPDQYVSGPLLVSSWLHVLAGGLPSDFEKCVRDYYDFLCTYWQENENTGNSFDLLPFNIVVNDEGKWITIDKEWCVDLPLTPEYLLFRALFWFPGGNESVLAALFAEYNITTLKDFIAHYFKRLSLPLEKSLDQFVANEEALQSEIAEQLRDNPIQNMLVQPLRQHNAGAVSTSFLAQLYWAGPDDEWSEDKSLFEPAQLGPESQIISFRIPPAHGHITKFRYDPADRAGFFRMDNIRISAIADHNNGPQEIWELVGNGSIARSAGLHNIEYCKNGLGDVFISTGNDPHFIFDVPEKVEQWLNSTGIYLSVTMDWPKSSDYLVVMDTLGKRFVEQQIELQRLQQVEKLSSAQVIRISEQAAKLKETSDQVRSKDIYIESIEKEIETMRQTRVWRVAEFLRARIYYRLLDGRTLCRKGIKTLRQEGFRQFLRKARRQLTSQPDSETLGLNRTDYTTWVEHNRLTAYDIDEIRTNISEFQLKPLFSIVVPVYDVDQEWLERTIDSVRSQLYENWELCLCDDLSPSPHVKKILQQYAEMDPRIKVLFKEKNEGIAIASNAALSLATGDYVGLLDHDDELTIDALYENARMINQNPGAGLLYSDEDKLDMQGRRCDPFFKPDYSPELIRSQNYICHFTVIKKSILDDLGGFRQGFDGSQDHDLILRVLEKTSKVVHIPKILYHWRKIPGSTAAVYSSKSYAWEAGRKAVEDSLQRLGVAGNVGLAKFQGSYRVSNTILENPLVTIIIPFKDRADLLKTAINSILEKTAYKNFEILAVNNNSSEKETFSLIETYSKNDRVRFIEYNVPFNFSDINNHAVKQANGEYITLLNNDIEIISPEWLDAMLEFAQLPEVGAVGGRLYYSDDRIQHAGIVIGMAGVAGPPHYLFHKDDVGYYARSHVIHNVSAVTGACLMVKKSVYESVGGLDAENFGVAYNDIDFCLKLIQKGYRNVFTPYCEMYHYESQSRGYEDTPEKQERLQRESSAFREKWKIYFDKGDPYYSPHLSLEKTNFTIRIR